MNEILCPECSHPINDHSVGWGECQIKDCECRLLPQDVAHRIFQSHETFLVRLCEILKVPYEDTSEEDILAKVKELREIRDGLEYDPYHMRWINKR